MLTYDELLERARFLVDKTAAGVGTPQARTDGLPIDLDELPF